LFRILYPKMYVSSVSEIQPVLLKELGIKAVLLDLDNTIVRRDAFHFTPAVSNWLSELRSLGLELCIVSNNSRGRVGSIAGLMDLPAVPRAVKPFVSSFRRTVQELIVNQVH
jgi:HAD superfamily phosphatase (TIGR01668 family)